MPIMLKNILSVKSKASGESEEDELEEWGGSRLHLDTESLIAAVGARRELWDPHHAQYRCREERAAAWAAVCHALLPHYHRADKATRKHLEHKVMQRWRTARDCYVKARTAEAAGSRPRPYLYLKRLNFLDSTLNAPRRVRGRVGLAAPATLATATSPSPPALTRSRSCSSGAQSPERSLPPPPAPACPRAPRREALSAFEARLLRYLRQDSPLRADDLDFFKSLAPILNEFSSSQKLEFRQRVLGTAVALRGGCADTWPLSHTAAPAPLSDDEPPETKYLPPPDASTF